MFTERDIIQFDDLGIETDTINQQLAFFREGFRPLKIVSAAVVGNGIQLLDDDEISQFIELYENSLSAGLKAMKFVPASGAATRMFHDLFHFLEKAKACDDIEALVAKDEKLLKFFIYIEKFAFYAELSNYLGSDFSKTNIAEKILYSEGLNYSNLPKALVLFHKLKEKNKTAIEEHIIEAANYCTGSNGIAKLHLTITPEHQPAFEKLMKRVKVEYEKRFGVSIELTFSHQKNSTNTIAVDSENTPFRNSDGTLLFRPGGHGALLENLNDLSSDLIFIKNIDNVVPDRLKPETIRYKKALAGMLITNRNKTYTFLEKLDKKGAKDDKNLLNSIDNFLKKQLCIHFDDTFADVDEKIEFYKSKLNRPIRICGMVKNEGEPGGGPFWAINHDNSVSLQIIEKMQLDHSDEQHLEAVTHSTHFNPVDIVCCINDYKGKKFDLMKFRDNDTGFISMRSKDGQKLKALELPGLWNGSMSDWNTILVEVPSVTFNPVKTVFDLLRPEHL